MTEQDWSQTDRDNYFDPTGNGSNPPPPEPNVTYITDDVFDAPDFINFLKPDQTARSKEYEQRVKSMMKAVTISSFKNNRVTDGAAFMKFGPGFARAAGNLADSSDSVAKTIDMLTAPDNPWFVFASITTAMTLQLFRNHEQEASQVATTWRQRRAQRKELRKQGIKPEKPQGTPVTIKGPFGKKFTLRVKVPGPKVLFSLIHAQTQVPDELAHEVLSSDKIRKALEKQGIKIMVVHNGD